MKFKSKILLLVVLAIVLLGFSWQLLWKAAQQNQLSLLVLNAVLADPANLPEAYAQLKQGSVQNCDDHWFLGITAGKVGDIGQQQSAWSEYLDCSSPEAVSLVQAAAPQNKVLANKAAQVHPDQPESYFWLAEIAASEKQPDQALQYYQRVAQLDPANALAWCRLGSLLRSQDLDQAKAAFLNCCYLGDPGSNGCVNAGGIEEQQGNWRTAIQYYRLSRWEKSQQRADELEEKMTNTP